MDPSGINETSVAKKTSSNIDSGATGAATSVVTQNTQKEEGNTGVAASKVSPANNQQKEGNIGGDTTSNVTQTSNKKDEGDIGAATSKVTQANNQKKEGNKGGEGNIVAAKSKVSQTNNQKKECNKGGATTSNITKADNKKDEGNTGVATSKVTQTKNQKKEGNTGGATTSNVTQTNNKKDEGNIEVANVTQTNNHKKEGNTGGAATSNVTQTSNQIDEGNTGEVATTNVTQTNNQKKEGNTGGAVRSNVTRTKNQKKEGNIGGAATSNVTQTNNKKKEDNTGGATTSNITQTNNQMDKVTLPADEIRLARYLELYKATVWGDWALAKRIFEDYPDSLTAAFNSSRITVLHLAAASGSPKSKLFLQQLTDLMVQNGEPLKAVNNQSRNALHYAARAGNTEAAMLLVDKDPTLTQQLNKAGDTPLHVAASCGHRETVRYLLLATRRQDPALLAGKRGVRLLNNLIMDAFYDIAIELIEENPGLATEKSTNGNYVLETLARKPKAFPSGHRLPFWERLLYHAWEKLLVNNWNSSQREDIENPVVLRSETCWKNFPLLGIFSKFHSEKMKYKQVLQLLKSLAEKAAKSNQASAILGPSTRLAAEAGIHEFVAEIIKAYPHVLLTTNTDRRTIFDVAIIHRQEKVYSLLFQLSTWKYFAMGFDKYSNTPLHLAAKLEPSTRIDKIPGAALQMQHELQWYKAVEQFVHPWYKVVKNKENKVPDMLFFESHKELVKEGEAWMKHTANSYTIVAALVVTVAFAAAFTAPGGNHGENGLPIFLNDAYFMVFAIANTLALFSSTTSLLMFLGILTSRYSQEEFYRALPTRLAIGQITLFFAIASMIVAFAASVNIVLSHRVAWIIVPIGLLACLPLSLFLILQFPLVMEVVWLTFGPSIFRKHSNEMLM